jgi:hypothetical protein
MSKRDYAAVAALVAIAGVVFTAVGLSLTKFCIGLAILAFIVVVWRRVEHAPPLDPVQGGAVVVLLASVAAAIISASGGGGENRSAPDPHHEASPGEVVRVYNRVTSGPRSMREDDEAVALTTKPVAFCGERDCRIAGTSRETGDTYDAAVCQHQGERVTNGQDTSRVDDHNPGLFSSRRYYGVRLDEDTFGYVSEVWIDPKVRGGLRLPRC